MVGNEEFSEYVIERLETSIVSVSSLIEHLRTNVVVSHEVDVVSSAVFAELLECLRRK